MAWEWSGAAVCKLIVNMRSGHNLCAQPNLLTDSIYYRPTSTEQLPLAAWPYGQTHSSRSGPVAKGLPRNSRGAGWPPRCEPSSMASPGRCPPSWGMLPPQADEGHNLTDLDWTRTRERYGPPHPLNPIARRPRQESQSPRPDLALRRASMVCSGKTRSRCLDWPRHEGESSTSLGVQERRE